MKKENRFVKNRIKQLLWGGVLLHSLLFLSSQNIWAADSAEDNVDKLDEILPKLTSITTKKSEKFRLNFLDGYPGTQLSGGISICGPMRLEGKQDSLSLISSEDKQEIISKCALTSNTITIAREIHLASSDARDILGKFFNMKFTYPNNGNNISPFKKLRDHMEDKLGPLGNYFERIIIIGEEVDLVPGDTFARGDADFTIILIRRDGKSIGWSINWWYAS